MLPVDALRNKKAFPRIVGNKNSFPTYLLVTTPRVPPSQSCRNLRFSASGLRDFWRERHFSRSPVVKSRVVGEPIAESRVVGEPIVAWKMYCYIFPLKMYGYILESRVVGEPIAESRVVGEPVVACGNGFQFPSLYRQKRFSISCEVGRERRKRFSVFVLVQTETVFSFRRVWQRTEETVFSFRTIFRK